VLEKTNTYSVLKPIALKPIFILTANHYEKLLTNIVFTIKCTYQKYLP
jgi:hypothetical protein